MGLIEAIVVVGLTFGTITAGQCAAEGVDPDKCFTKENITVEHVYPNSHGNK
jgi:hypothetical protein